LFGRFSKPLGGQTVFLRHATSDLVTNPEMTLGRFVSLVGRFAKPLYRLFMILVNTLPGLVTNSKVALRIGLARFGGLLDFFNRLRYLMFFSHFKMPSVRDT
jgi:hypothetical protein